MTPEHTVSVVIPAYNSAATLSAALQSVFAQTRKVTEVIVVDDGSVDDTPRLVRDFGPAVICLRQSYNQGAAAARNRGVDAATGRWIAFLDSDDRWHPEKIARQLELLVGGNYRLACTGFRVFRGTNTSPLIYSCRDVSVGFDTLVRGCRLSPGSTLIAERAMFDEFGGFDTGLKRLEDWDWLLRVTINCSIGISSELLADIYNYTFPDYAKVVDACTVMEKKWLKGETRLRGTEARRLYAALAWEGTHSAYRCKRLGSMLWHLGVTVAQDPIRVLAMIANMLNRRFATIKQQ